LEGYLVTTKFYIPQIYFDKLLNLKDMYLFKDLLHVGVYAGLGTVFVFDDSALEAGPSSANAFRERLEKFKLT
jgi:hypothetical protein